jgi:hypothetical protein
MLAMTRLSVASLLLQIQFRGDGPLGSILAVADTKGQVKGRVGNPEADPPLRPDGKLNVGAAVGQGESPAEAAAAAAVIIQHSKLRYQYRQQSQPKQLSTVQGVLWLSQGQGDKVWVTLPSMRGHWRCCAVKPAHVPPYAVVMMEVLMKQPHSC